MSDNAKSLLKQNFLGTRVGVAASESRLTGSAETPKKMFENKPSKRGGRYTRENNSTTCSSSATRGIRSSFLEKQTFIIHPKHSAKPPLAEHLSDPPRVLRVSKKKTHTQIFALFSELCNLSICLSIICMRMRRPIHERRRGAEKNNRARRSTSSNNKKRIRKILRCVRVNPVVDLLCGKTPHKNHSCTFWWMRRWDGKQEQLLWEGQSIFAKEEKLIMLFSFLTIGGSPKTNLPSSSTTVIWKNKESDEKEKREESS